MSEIIDALQYCRLFSAVDRSYLISIEPQLKTIELVIGDKVYNAGEQVPGLFVIMQGAVRLNLAFLEAYNPLVTIVRAGRFFGDHDIFSDKPCLATATCVESTTLILFNTELFFRVFGAQPSVSQRLARSLTLNCRQMSQLYGWDMTQGVEARLAKLIRHLYHIQTTPTDSDAPLVINHSHNELADMIGLTRTAISKPLKQWKEQGWIEIKNKEIRVLDLSALSQFVT